MVANSVCNWTPDGHVSLQIERKNFFWRLIEILTGVSVFFNDEGMGGTTLHDPTKSWNGF